MADNKRLIERKHYMQRLRDLRGRNIIKVITGVRRSGKSTLLQMFAEELRQSGVPEGRIQFYNFEDPDVYALGDWKAIYDHIKIRLVPDEMNYLFLDEVQNVDVFQRLVDGLFIKKNCDVYVTGSNAHLLSGELATLLTGRYIATEVLPFSYREYVEFLDRYSNAPEASGGSGGENKAKFLKLLKKESFGNLAQGGVLSTEMVMHERLFDFQYDGGMPYAVGLGVDKQEQSKDFLRSVLDAIVEKDIFQRHKIHAKANFRKLIDFLMDSIGSPVSPNSIANVFKSEGLPIDNKTVSQHLDYLTASFLFYKVPRYDLKGKGLLRTLDKYYLSDTGFRKVFLAKGKTADLGHLLENVVYLELRRRYADVHTGKWSGKEVDFVAIDRDGNVTYFQVAFSARDPKTLERELAPLKAIRDSNPKYLLTMDFDMNPVYDGIRKLHVADWLLGEKV